MKIKSIKKITVNEERYDIQTKNHNFFANGILVHNSLIKVVKFSDQEILVSTNGVIDAFKCKLNSMIGCPYNNFGELFWAAVSNQMDALNISSKYNDRVEWLAHKLEYNITYMFELCSKYNKIVVPHDEPKLYFHGLRNNLTLKELDSYNDYPSLALWFNTPKQYLLKSLDDCLKAASVLPWDNEGYVVCDKDFHRVKVKSPAYCQAHLMANNGSLSLRRAIEIWAEGEVSELITYFPEYKDVFDKIENSFQNTIKTIDSLYKELINQKLNNRKEQSNWILTNAKFYSGCLFRLLDKPIEINKLLMEIYNKNKDGFSRLLNLENQF
jgi:hypothetical protein